MGLRNVSEPWPPWRKAAAEIWTGLVKTRHDERRVERVVDNVQPLLADLKSCSMKKDLEWGKRLHFRAIEDRNDSDKYVATALVKMYAKCSSMVEARRVFECIQEPDVVSWTVLLLGYVETGKGDIALELFSKMSARGCVPDYVTYMAAFKACTSLAVNGDDRAREESLERGRQIHLQIGCHLNHSVQNTLIYMYAKCGSMVEARRVFDDIQKPDLVSWNSLLLGYAESGEGRVALQLFSRMKAHGCAPDSMTYVAALKACSCLAKDGKEDILDRGRLIHSELGDHLNHYVQNALMDMYANCGSMVDARCVFDCIRKPDVVSWNTILLGYAEIGEGHIALDLFERMKAQRCNPSPVTYVAVLKACSLTGALTFGRKLHSELSEVNTHVLTCLVDFYAKCGSVVEAREVFELHWRVRRVPTWTALLAGYSSLGDSDSAFDLFQSMQDQGFRPDSITFVCILLCCSHAGLVEKAREYFEVMPARYGLAPTVMHYTCMVDVLGRANKLNEAIAVVKKMPCNPDAVIWRSLLGACRKWKNVEIGRKAFQALADLDRKNSSSYVLMSHLYGCRGLWEKQEELRQAHVTDESGKMVKFEVDRDFIDVKERLQKLCETVKEDEDVLNIGGGGAADIELEEAVCGHSERRAVVFGILRMSHAGPVRIFKNTRMCRICHCTSKMISKVVGNVLMIRDANRFHVMINGNCSCRDDW